jgi:hypothetical protein
MRNLSSQTNICPIATLSIRNPPWINLPMNPRFSVWNPVSTHLTQPTEVHSFLCLPSICCYLPKSYYISDQYEDVGRSTVTTLSDPYSPTILSVRSYNQNLGRDAGVESHAIGGIFIWTAGTCGRLAGGIYMASGHRTPRSYDIRVQLYGDFLPSTWLILYKSITAYSDFL